MYRALAGQSLRYLLIGAFCAGLNNVVLISGEAVGLHYVASILLTFAIVQPASYLAHAWWTFDQPLSLPALGRFLMGSITGMILAGFTVGIMCGPFHLPMIVAAPSATVVTTIYNFMMTRWAVTHRQAFNNPR